MLAPGSSLGQACGLPSKSLIEELLGESFDSSWRDGENPVRVISAGDVEKMKLVLASMRLGQPFGVTVMNQPVIDDVNECRRCRDRRDVVDGLEPGTREDSDLEPRFVKCLGWDHMTVDREWVDPRMDRAEARHRGDQKERRRLGRAPSGSGDRDRSAVRETEESE